MFYFFNLPGHVGKRTAACSLLFFSIIVATPGYGVEETRSISLQEAVDRTLSSNPELQAFGYQLKAQEGRIQQAGRSPSPELSLEMADALGSGDYEGLENAQTSISIGWVLERGIRQRHINAARAGSELISIERDIKRFDVAAETARRYLVSLALQARLENADKTVRLSAETIEAVEKRVKAGRTPEAELSRAQAELEVQNLTRKGLMYQRHQANLQLAALWGTTTLDFSRVEGDILSLPQLEPLAVLTSNLLNNPVFERFLSNQRLKQAELELALAQDTPSWKLNAGVRRFEGSDDLALMAGFSIPIGERTKNPGRVLEARTHLEAIDMEKTKTRLYAESSLHVLYEKVQHGIFVIKTTKESILPKLEEALAGTRRAYNLGRYGYLELQSVQAELLGAHESLIEASIDVHQNIIEIERLTGMSIAHPRTEL
ncbi:MAG: TolC family protein [Gammaproteobacteria bacterium]|nr:TolC family protein [Gammaproteobacteria bacterium]